MTTESINKDEKCKDALFGPLCIVLFDSHVAQMHGDNHNDKAHSHAQTILFFIFYSGRQLQSKQQLQQL